MLTALWAILEVLTIGIVGYLIIAGRDLEEESHFSFLSKTVTRLALPALMFTTMAIKFSPDKTENWWLFPAHGSCHQCYRSRSRPTLCNI